MSRVPLFASSYLLAAALVGLSALASACSEAASAPPEAPEQSAAEFRSARVDAAMDAASRVVETRGFAAEGESSRGFLVEQASAVRPLPMRTGNCYVVIGVSSEALRQLDLRLFESDGGEVVQDAAQGASAALRFCPAHSGTYYLALRATSGSGLYALRTFRGPTGLAMPTEDLVRALRGESAPPETP